MEDLGSTVIPHPDGLPLTVDERRRRAGLPLLGEWHRIDDAAARQLQRAPLHVVWGKWELRVVANHAGGETVYSDAFIPSWLHELLRLRAPVLMHNAEAFRGQRLVWLWWVAENSSALEAAFRLGGVLALLALNDEWQP